jgi:hypothetical protein
MSRLDALERDERGHPIPFIVLRDAEGKPVFAANDVARIRQAIHEGLCHVCGQALEGEPVWFVGGPGSALLNGPRGIYYDGPMHHECMRYSVEHCPHLAHQMVKPVSKSVQKRLAAQGIAFRDTTIIPGVPEVFVAVSPYRYEAIHGTFIAYKPFRKIEYWHGGKLLPLREGEKFARQAARRVDTVSIRDV